MVTVGFDFGTTYSSSFYWDEDEGFKSLISSHEGNPTQPTIASKNGDNWKYGVSAREQLNNSNVPHRVFKGFKMLLGNMADASLITQNGYETEGVFSPASITKDYLKEMLQKALSNCPCRKIEKLVVGVPERWYDNAETFSARSVLESILEDIKKEIPKEEGSVRIIDTVSEPALACAYYAWKYRKNRLKAKKSNPDFNEFMLVIDYGGGTLDINFCEVKQTGDICEISVRARGGETDNDLGRTLLGQAGLKFIRCVIDKVTKDQDIEMSNRIQLEHILESYLMSEKENIDKNFSSARTSEQIKKLREEKWLDLLPNIPITYGDLMDVFEKEIKMVLNKALKDIDDKKAKLREKDDKLLDIKNDFKIALTGGFCDFFLTKQAVFDHYKITNPEEDARTEDMDMGNSGFRYAITYGAALVAEEIIQIKKTYPFTLGIEDDETHKRWIAFKYGEDMQLNRPCWVYEEDDKKRKPCALRASDIPLVFYDSDGSGSYICKAPRNDYRTLFQLPGDPMKTLYMIGFSINENMNIKIHFQEMVEDKSDHKFKKKDVKEIVSKPVVLYSLLHNKLESVGIYEGEE